MKNGVPAMGQPFEVTLPMMLVNQMHLANGWMKGGKNIKEVTAEVVKFLATNYAKARDEVEKDKDTMKAFFKSQKDMPGKTKADVLKDSEWDKWGQH